MFGAGECAGGGCRIPDLGWCHTGAHNTCHIVVRGPHGHRCVFVQVRALLRKVKSRGDAGTEGL